MVNSKSDHQYHREISDRVTSLLISRPFYGLYLNTLSKMLTDDHQKYPTMAVALEGVNYKLIVNRMFWDGLNRDQQIAILVHEAHHIMFGHLTQHDNYPNPGRANEAMDIYINYNITKDAFFGATPFPAQDLTKEQYEQQYGKQLVDLAEQRDSGAITMQEFWQQFYQIPMRGVFVDDYPDISIQDVEMGTAHIYDLLTKIEENNNDNGGGGCSSSQPAIQRANDKNLPHRTQHSDWVDITKMDPIQKKLIQNQAEYIIKGVAEEVEKSEGIGGIPSEFKGLIDALRNPPKPIRNWKKMIRDWVGGFGNSTIVKRSFFRPNLILPELPRIKVKYNKHIVVVIDTSGSVGQNLLKQFFHVILNVKRLTECKVTVIECDAYVDEERGVYELKNMKQINDRLTTGMVTGGGGTSVDPAIAYIETRGDVTGMMYLTDGYLNKPHHNPLVPFVVVKEENGADLSDWGIPIIDIPQNWGQQN